MKFVITGTRYLIASVIFPFTPDPKRRGAITTVVSLYSLATSLSSMKPKVSICDDTGIRFFTISTEEPAIHNFTFGICEAIVGKILLIRISKAVTFGV